MSPPGYILPKFPTYSVPPEWRLLRRSDPIRDAEDENLGLTFMAFDPSRETASAWVQSIHTALGLATVSASPGGILSERWRRWRANSLAAKGWKKLQQNADSCALAICQSALRVYPYCASARGLHARLALREEGGKWYSLREERRNWHTENARRWYIAWLALAVLEQKDPPSCKVRHEELAWFVLS